jgi:hypothetical protein
MAAEAACIPDPWAVWVRSTMTEAKIQVLVDRRLLQSKAEVEWKAAAEKEFPSEVHEVATAEKRKLEDDLAEEKCKAVEATAQFNTMATGRSSLSLLRRRLLAMC